MGSKVIKFYTDRSASKSRHERHQRLAKRGVERYKLLALPEAERFGKSRIGEWLASAGTANPAKPETGRTRLSHGQEFERRRQARLNELLGPKRK
jgi:hypothetical protein